MNIQLQRLAATVVAAAATVLLTSCALGPAQPAPVAAVVEALPATSWKAGAMIAAANPLAVDAGLEVLAEGGSAVDAAIAVQALLGLVEPQSSGLGGGAFMLHYDAASGDVVAYDGREVAPAGATPDMFLGDDGKPLRFFDAVKSGRSIGVPGVIAMLELAHREHGRLPWSRPWQPAIRLAENGFKVPRRLALVAQQARSMSGLAPDAQRYLTRADGQPLEIGDQLRNPDYAATAQRIAREGARAFYEGPIAEAIVAAAQREPRPGSLTLQDLSAYRATRHEPLCAGYRVYLVCSMRPPSSGGVAILEILGMLEHLPIGEAGPASVDGWHYLIEAQRLAYADRDRYVADDRFVRVPIDGMLDRNYLASRAALIRRDVAIEKVTAGEPPGALPFAPDTSGGTTGTSHFVIVDARGNVVSMTTTVESLFGSQRMVGGFFLNNQLTDFSLRPVDDAGRPIANAVAGGKKPRSSMSPTIVFEQGRFKLAVGSPGGNSIIAYVSKALVGMLDWGLTPGEAIELPNVVARGAVSVEKGRMDAAMLAELAARGQVFREVRGAEASGLHAVLLTPSGRLLGGADSRRDGVALSPAPAEAK